MRNVRYTENRKFKSILALAPRERNPRKRPRPPSVARWWPPLARGAGGFPGTRRQRDTIESQLEMLQIYARQHGYEILSEHRFLDNGVSGAQLARPELERLRDGVQMGEIDAVLILSPDRLARSYAHQWLLLEEFKKWHCEVIFIQTPFHDTPRGHLLLQVQSMMAEYEREQIKDRTRRGRLAKARKGEFIPLAYKAYGLRYVHKQFGTLPGVEIEPREAQVIGQRFSWLADEQLSTRQITKRLNAQGIPTKTGANRIWQPATVQRILTNPLYTGRGYYNKGQPAPPKERRRRFPPRPPVKRQTRKARPRSEWIEAQAPAIISEETFAKARVQLAENRQKAARMYRPSSRRYLLRTLIRCGACGLGMQSVRQNGGGRYEYLYYECKGNVPLSVGRATRCNARRIRADRLDPLVWSALVQLLQQPETLEKEYQLYQGLYQGEQSQFEAQLARLETQGSRLQRQLQRLLDTYQHERIELVELGRRRARLVTQQTAVDKQPQQLQFQQRQCLQWGQVVEGIEAFNQQLGDRLDTLSFEEQQKLVELLIEKIVVFSNGDVEIHHLLPTGGATSGSQNGRSSAIESCPTEESTFYRLRLEDHHHLLMGNGGNDAQGATAAKRKIARLPPPTQWRKTGRKAPSAHAVAEDRSQGSLRPHSGGRQVAMSTLKTWPSNLAQFQYGIPVFISSSLTPCWRSVEMIPSRSLLCGAKHPA